MGVGESLREVLSRKGATDAQLNAKVVGLMEEAISEGAVDGMKTAESAAKRLMNTVNTASRDLDNKILRAGSHEHKLTQKIAEAERAVELVTEVTKQLDESSESIKDKATIDGVNAYSLILTRTKGIVGEDMTEAIWIKTIEAASYGMWRSIMGPKDQPKANNRY